MDALLEQLKDLATADSAGRYRVLDSIRSLQLSLETPLETVLRLSGQQLSIAVARIGLDVGIFRALVESEKPLNTAALAAGAGTAPMLLGRILRYLASVGMIQEVSPDTFTANSQTRTLADPGYSAGIYTYFDNFGPVYQALPEFLAATGYRDIVNENNTPFQKVFLTDLPVFRWLATQPERSRPLHEFMTTLNAEGVPWFDAFPLERELGSFSGPHVLVDVGGGFGQQCVNLKLRYPALQGKLVLQDLPQTLEQLPPPIMAQLDGVERMPHDFFAPQPVEGSRFYYIRQVLHNWSDESCVAILRRLVAAFGSESQILIDERVFPESGATWEATTADLMMMGSLASRERTAKEWHTLLDMAGLRILQVHSYFPRWQHSIIQAVSK